MFPLSGVAGPLKSMLPGAGSPSSVPRVIETTVPSGSEARITRVAISPWITFSWPQSPATKAGGACVKFAASVVLALRASWQTLPTTESQPNDHSVNVDPGLGCGVSEIGVPWAKLAEQAMSGQSMPAGVEVTSPSPEPMR